MTLPRKGSRTINVDGTVYRWKASPVRTEPPMVGLIVHEDTLPAKSMLDLAVWEAQSGSILVPSQVEALIRVALRKGWQPKSRGNFRIGPDQLGSWFNQESK
jgi:hypothetical protein